MRSSCSKNSAGFNISYGHLIYFNFNYNMNIKPVSIFSSIQYFIISSLIIYFGVYYGIPFLEKSGLPFFAGYLIFFHIPLALLLITTIIIYFKEGHQKKWQDFKERLWLKKMSGRDWFWALGLFIFSVIAYFALAPLGKTLAGYSFFRPPDFFPPEINPNKIPQPGCMMDFRLSGQYWIIPAYFFAWITNILGEEFLFRGIIFPRQLEKYGNKAWIYHGIIWTLWHFFWKWNLLSIFPFAMALSFTVYKRKNICISIFAHGTMNIIPFIMIIIEVLK
jgi:membrane protease YdiL (CAAX protease family)